ncbi:MAG TPA: sensor histidine kinase [Spirochaetota bacterium]|nr:sensor histidine kinase [Spirochaetota bacterium]HQO03386.1 sensor histidine kinase [Spirochaetota bacterium]
MNFIVLLNIGSLVMYGAAALFIIASTRKKSAAVSLIIITIILMGIPLFICTSNILEHMSITNALDDYEGFMRDLFALFLLLFLYLDSMHRELNRRKINEQQISSDLEEKTILLKEIHHRVKNNLQIVSSLLSLQCERQNNMLLSNYIAIAKNRILSMAAVHEIIYSSQDLSRLAAREFINSIIINLVTMYEPEKHHIAINRSLDEHVHFNVDIAIPVGLIINELLSNALQHAFADNRPGIVSITLLRKADTLEMIIEDNGTGMEAVDSREQHNGLGMMLVQTLVQQIKGEMKILSSNGTTISIHIPYSVQPPVLNQAVQ